MGESAGSRECRRSRTIPERTDQINGHRAKGPLGEKSPDSDAALYRECNTVERCFARRKQRCGIATRYDKHSLTHLATIVLNRRIHI